MSAATLEKPPAENTERPAPEDRAVLVLTAKDLDEGRKQGRITQHLRANERKAFYLRVGIQAVMDNYDQRNYLTRKGIIDNIRAACFAYEFKGKSGKNIQERTINRWLTRKIEHSIKLEAINRLIARGNS